MTPRLIFDVEANGLLEEATKIHCIAAIDIDSGSRYVWRYDEILDAIRTLNSASTLVAHNGLRYDYPLLYKLCAFNPTGELLDSLVCARLIRSNQKDIDFLQKAVPGKMIGSHSLEAWGHRLGYGKAVYEGGWAEWSQAMQDYCVQDVEVCLRLWQYLEPWKYSQKAIDLEHRIASVCHTMEQSGWYFSIQSAGLLHARLVEEQSNLTVKLKKEFGPFIERSTFVPKVNNKARGYTKGVTFIKTKEVEFNPASRQHIYKKLMELGWKPQVFTESGQPQVDESVLDQIEKDFPQAGLLSRWLMLNKRIGQLATGDNAWLKLVTPNGTIHPGYNTNGCVTGRASHLTPNIAQVPRVGKAFGAECRSLFVVPSGWVMLGADQSGLEQRCLANYTSIYDKGEYAKTSLESEDIHWLHAVAIGIAKGDEDGDFRRLLRDCTKTWFYAYIYGARDPKLTSILSDLQSDSQKLGYNYTGVSSGEQSRENFGKRIPALERLRAEISQIAKTNKVIKAIDGRLIPCDAMYKALNYACQSAGAIICKEWVADTYETLAKDFKYGYNGDFVFLGWIHDELQVAARKGTDVDRIRTIIIECGRRAGDKYGFRVPLDVEAKEGKTWAGTH